MMNKFKSCFGITVIFLFHIKLLGFVWVRNLVVDIAGGKEAEGV